MNRVYYLASLFLLMGLSSPLIAQSETDNNHSPHFYDRVVVLAIGIDSYWSINIDELSQAENEAKAVSSFFEENYGFESQVLLGKAASKSAILEKVQSLGDELGENSGLIIYFACHGKSFQTKHKSQSGVQQVKQVGYLLPYDAEVDLRVEADNMKWNEEGIDMQQLVDDLSQLNVEHVLVLADTCCSGFMTKRGSASSSDVFQLLSQPSRTIVSATTQFEGAQEGIFTPLLLKMMTRFSRDAEIVSITDVFQQLRPAVSSASNRQMTPQMGHVGSGDGEFFFFPKSIPRPTGTAIAAEVDNLKRVAVSGTHAASSGVVQTALRGVSDRVAKRAGRRTQLEEVVNIAEGRTHWYGDNAAHEQERWAGLRQRWLENAALGDGLAMAALHYCYSIGLGEPSPQPDPKQALHWAKMASAIEKPPGVGNFLLGRCYRWGLGVTKNERTAKRLYEESATAGFSLGEFGLADFLLEGQPTAEQQSQGVDLLKSAAESGIAQASYELGMVYISDRDFGVEKDFERGLRYFEEAYQQNSMLAAYALYEVYRDDTRGVATDLQSAEKYLRSASEKGLLLAQLELASELGHIKTKPLFLHLSKNSDEARRLLELAALQGFDQALITASRIHILGNQIADIGLPRDYAKGREYLEKACSSGSSAALLLKAFCHHEQLGDYEKDDILAMRFAREAAEKGNPIACSLVGEFYERGIGITGMQPIRNWTGHWVGDENHPYAHHGLHWYMKAIENGGNEHASERLEKFRRLLGIEKRENAEGRNFLLRQTGYALKKWKKDFPETAAAFEKRFP